LDKSIVRKLLSSMSFSPLPPETDAIAPKIPIMKKPIKMKASIAKKLAMKYLKNCIITVFYLGKTSVYCDLYP
jgi:hypothetical protein